MKENSNQSEIKTKVILKDEERQPCEVWTRVMGYHRPVTEFNPGKQSESRERKYFRESHLAFLKNQTP